MLRLIPYTIVIALAGCAAKVVDGNERGVIIKAAEADAGGAFKLANAECEKHNRKARLNSRPRDDNTWAFDCVQ